MAPECPTRYKSQSYHVLLCVVAHGSPHGEPKPAHCESFPDENLDPGVLGIGWLSTELIEHDMTACRVQRWRERHIPAFCLSWTGFISTNPRRKYVANGHQHQLWIQAECESCSLFAFEVSYQNEHGVGATASASPR
jgi:hypothetical protein